MRIEIQRARNEDVAGHSWGKNKNLEDQFDAMIEKRDKMRSEIEAQLKKEQGSRGPDYIHRLLEELEIH
jgi:hypothetical protein